MAVRRIPLGQAVIAARAGAPPVLDFNLNVIGKGENRKEEKG
jgi:hypothetical protein